MSTTFEKSEIGDKVWSLEHGWGKIAGQGFTASTELVTIMVEFGEGVVIKYNYKGRIITIYNECNTARAGKKQTLFWDEVKFDAPEKPKEKKSISLFDGYAYMPDGSPRVRSMICTKTEAEERCPPGKYVAKAYRIFEWEE